MEPFTLAALIAGGGALAGGLANVFGQRSANKTNVALANKANEFELEMWNRNNAYNTPQAQMQRLTEAGLNPNLIYGSGSGSTGLSSSYPKAHMASVSNELSQIGNPLSTAMSMYMDLKLKDAQINAINNNADLTLQKTINEGYKKVLMQSQAAKFDFDVSRGKELLPFQSSMLEQNIERTRNMNKDLLWKLSQRNPQEIAMMIERNKGLRFENTFIKPKQSSNLNMDISLKKQQLQDLNPSLMELRLMEKNLKELDFDLNKGLTPYNITSKDNFLYRLIPGIFNDKNPKRKDKTLISW